MGKVQAIPLALYYSMSFSGNLFTNWIVTGKGLATERNGVKFGTGLGGKGVGLVCVRGSFKLLNFKVILGSFDAKRLT